MSDDGAHLGYGMEAALKGALGGEEPPTRLTVQDLRERIEAASDTPDGYDACGNACAKVLLHFMLRHPEAANLPASADYEWPKSADGETDWTATPTVVQEGVYDYLKRIEPETYHRHREHIFGELTGFMAGWAVNAARRCLELPPVPNPAILEIG